MVFGGQQVQLQTMLMVQTAYLYLDVEKKRGEGAPPVTGRVAQMAHGR